MRSIPFIVAAALAGTSLAADASEDNLHRDPYFDPGGAVRFNYGWLDYGPTSRLQLELLRADLDAGTGPFSFSAQYRCCLLYTSPSPRDLSTSRMPSSA